LGVGMRCPRCACRSACRWRSSSCELSKKKKLL